MGPQRRYGNRHRRCSCRDKGRDRDLMERLRCTKRQQPARDCADGALHLS